ncbi:hypothetical protein TWF694_010391 [Orbilia ellipsospora]|uniref:Ribonuclease H2 subunit B n=1 Tax=Orbilia ellipsospora TaxID=2528407 RepID=A0AAV9XB06_9PEZI
MAAPKVFILPVGKGSEDTVTVSHTILNLKHPNSGQLTRYLLHHPPASEGSTSAPFLYEILKIANPVPTPRSWLITPDLPPLVHPTDLPKTADESKEEGVAEDEEDESESKAEEKDEPESNDENDEKDDSKEEQDDHEGEQEGQENPSDGTPDKSSLIIKDAHLYLTTPIDPIYLLVPHLTSDKTSRNFLSLEDLLDGHSESSTWSKILKLHPPAEKLLQSRLLTICDTVEAADEVMYRINTKKLTDLLLSRVQSVAKSLPPSLTKHINRKLSKPLGAQARSWRRQVQQDTSGGIVDDAELEDDSKETGGETQEVESQLRREASRLNLNEESGTNTPAEIDTQVTAVVEEESLLPPPEILWISQLGHAVQFMQNYVPSSVYTALVAEVHRLYPIEPLEAYQEELKTLRAAASQAMDFTMSHTKRTIEDLEGGVSREEAEREKKRKKKEADGKKSQAVKKLEKVNTTGMKKMTAFFKKKE